jgi:hypothetical protein
MSLAEEEQLLARGRRRLDRDAAHVTAERRALVQALRRSARTGALSALTRRSG